MGPRPAHLNLRNGQEQNGQDEVFDKPRMPLLGRDLPSPRAGEAPPAMSPLDFIAMQGRILKQQLAEEKRREQQAGRRVSRLDHKLVEQEFRNRPDFFRSISDQSRMTDVAEEEEDLSSPQSYPGGQIAMQSPERDRPMSYYPTLERASYITEDGAPDVPAVPTPFYDAQEGTGQDPHTAAKSAGDYFGIPRATSPEPVEPNVNVQAPSPNVPPSLSNSIDTISSHPRTRTNDSQRSQRSLQSQRSERERGLAPPQSPRFPKSPRSFQSIRSVPQDSGDEDTGSTSGSQGMPSARKFSGSSNMSRPQSPFSPLMQPIHRSPSMTSEYSINGTQQMQRPSPAFNNFSRPMSSSGSRPSFDAMRPRPSFEGRPSIEQRPAIPHRQASDRSSSTEASYKPAMSRGNSGDDVKPNMRINTKLSGSLRRTDLADVATPSLHGQPIGGFNEDGAITPGGTSSSSYIYAKYALPRGRPVDRDSTAFRDSWIQKQLEWDTKHGHAHSPEGRGHERNQSDGQAFDASNSPALSDTPRMGRSLAPEPSTARSLSADPRGRDQAPVKTSFDRSPLRQSEVASFHQSSPSVKTESTDRTIKPLHRKALSADITPEEHLDIGIEAHDAGATNKSTYHLRLAAMAGLPTAMLLYALACRHGWGMRANQAEGVKWLRKAIDTAGLDVADAEEKLNSTSGNGKKLDPAERKKRKAQYALAIYELGISSMNGWGCTKDKALAVRCYEIAGSWGDVDALAEAAFCYTQGVGVKKDLKRAAALYRRAADMGMSMAGNSWIYKTKYMEPSTTTSNDPPSSRDKDQKKYEPPPIPEDSGRDRERPTGGSRSRSRSIWGKRKSEKAEK
ncbi:Putative tetratricopeptide-like helical domain superfamily [Septoria linicola]|uniref:Tetratricopeptide-like helical domain superfamily n=1 Tax=Septoria linicola TaxID=215465 RepID=A0A9Q9EKK0_9PEZI|nr:putative tetratricopeptide-like helical domain superfamily [Septoria linicola]USW54135.1 Putative tetratricopeptide-like helical domain superfamily [Septoria linicola]